MHYLVFIDELREHAVWIVLAFLVCLAVLMLRAPLMQVCLGNGPFCTSGALLLGLVSVVLCMLGVGIALGGLPPTERIGFRSKTGVRSGLLSHAELRDGAATRVTVNGDCCFRRYIAYEYFGDGEDHMGAESIKWVDDHHLMLTYVRDSSGIQQCHPRAGDVQVTVKVKARTDVQRGCK